MTVRFRLLGDVRADVDGRPVALGHARQRCVLAALLVDANRVVPVDQLADRVWGSRQPQRARGALYTYVSRLRRALAGAGGVQVVSQGGGYLLAVGPEAVDVHLFGRLVSQARAAGTDAEAFALFEQALGLWRGQAFAVLDSPWLETVREDLNRQRLAAELDRNDLALRQGRHGELLAELATATADHPLDERLAGQLMLALYRSGRRADALAHYRQLRRRLADELGTDPGPALQQLHQDILATNPGLAAPASPP